MSDQEKKNVLEMPEELVDDMNRHLPGDLTIQDIQRLFFGRPIKILFRCSDELMNTELSDMLDLSHRSSNALHRAGYRTVADLINNLQSFEELTKVRNCGKRSIAEIQGRLFFYQYSLIPKEQRTDYMEQILKRNGIT